MDYTEKTFIGIKMRQYEVGDLVWFINFGISPYSNRIWTAIDGCHINQLGDLDGNGYRLETSQGHAIYIVDDTQFYSTKKDAIQAAQEFLSWQLECTQ